jgi:hypothetical protein
MWREETWLRGRARAFDHHHPNRQVRRPMQSGTAGICAAARRAPDRETSRLAVPAFVALVCAPLWLLAVAAIAGQLGSAGLELPRLRARRDCDRRQATTHRLRWVLVTTTASGRRCAGWCGGPGRGRPSLCAAGARRRMVNTGLARLWWRSSPSWPCARHSCSGQRATSHGWCLARLRDERRCRSGSVRRSQAETTSRLRVAATSSWTLTVTW